MKKEKLLRADAIFLEEKRLIPSRKLMRIAMFVNDGEPMNDREEAEYLYNHSGFFCGPKQPGSNSRLVYWLGDLRTVRKKINDTIEYSTRKLCEVL